MRGLLLRLLAWACAGSPFLRDLVLAKMRKDAGISALPEHP